jgi:hypothetical protein
VKVQKKVDVANARHHASQHVKQAVVLQTSLAKKINKL